LKYKVDLTFFISNFLFEVTLGFYPASKSKSIGSSRFFVKPRVVLSVNLFFK